MEALETQLHVSHMPIDVLTIVTSYLGSTALTSLIKASDKLLLKKLRAGGVQSLNIVEMDETERQAPFSQDQLYSSHTQFPWFVDYDDKCNLFFLPPINFFSKLKTLCYALNRPSLRGGHLGLEHLPPTLTHLEWTAPNHIWRTRDGRPMKEVLPNLLHLGLRDSSFGFHATQPKEILQCLPQGLLSLRVQIAFANSIIQREAYLLPSNLTHLGVFATDAVDRLQCRYLESSTLLSKLPSSITNLQLHSFRWEVCEPICDTIGARITSLHLHSIDGDTRAYLPITLTRLQVVHDQTVYRRDQRPTWPCGLETIVIGRSSTFVLPCSSSVTRLKISEPMSEVNLNPRCDPEMGPFEFVTETLTILDLPQATIFESMLSFLPSSLTHISFQDVLMDGSSLPLDITHLDDIEQMNHWFWQVKRPFHLLLRHPSYPKTITRFRFQIPSKKVVSLKIGANFLQKLPRNLTRLANFTLDNESIHQLPTGLTSLHFFQRRQSTGVSLESLLHRLPRLKTLKSSPTFPQDGSELEPGSIQLDSCHFPILATFSSPNPPILNLPEDSIQILRKTHAPTLKLKGLAFHPFNLLKSISIVSASHATFVGQYLISESFLKHGFSSGLTMLDLTEGSLVQDVGSPRKVRPVIPPLPETLRELRLGGTLADSVCMKPSSASLPSTLAKLVLNITKAPSSTRELASQSPAFLESLVLRSPDSYSPDHIAHLYSRFASVEVSTSPSGHVLVATRGSHSQQAKCFVM